MSGRVPRAALVLPLALAACDGGTQHLGWTFAAGPNDSSLPGDTFQPWAGGPAYYRRWPLGPSPEPTFFPVAVWLQSPPNAARYAAAGVNTFTGLWMGPTDDQLAGVWSAHLDDPTIEAWMQPDGPDNAQLNASGGYDPCVDPATIQAGYQAFVASDPRRPVYLGLGRGVADTQWNGRGACTGRTEMYADYAKGGDLLAFHIYPHEDGVPIETVAAGVQNLVTWSEAKRPISATIEASDINGHGRPTPGEIAAEVWMSLVHGAAGVQYFCHRFMPTFSETDCLDDAPTAAALSAINERIRALAPVLNTPTVANGVEVVSSVATIPVDVMLKRQGGATTLFAVEMRGGTTTATFTLRALPSHVTIEALGEGRTLTATPTAGGMTFTDAFSSYAVHIYRVTD
jgi:hypothetical protein